MWGRDVGGAPGGLRLLLLLLPGAMGLQCLHCGSDAGSCRGAELVSCPTGSDVCVEALGAVAWSHGRFWLGGRGCGRGQPGSHARALQLAGLVLFSRRRHCREGRGCNAELPLGQEEALPDVAPPTPSPPNGLRCFGCPDDGPCDPPLVVECAGDQDACFHGNASLALGGRRLWREVRGCARGANCSDSARGDGDAALSGSCCHGDLCNGAHGGLFDPQRPRLQLLPHGHAPTAAPKMAATRAKMAAGGGGGNGDVGGVNGDVIRVNGDVNGGKDDAKMAAGGGGDVIKVNGDVIKVNGSVNGDVNGGKDGAKMAAGGNGDVVKVNGDVIKVNGSNVGVNGDVNGDVNGGKDDANMAAGGNGDVIKVNGDVIKVNGSVNRVNGDIIGVNGDVKGVNGSISGVNSDVTGVNGDVIRVNSDVIGVNGSINGDKTKVNMAAGVNGSVNGANGDVSKADGDVSGDVSAKMATGDKMAAGRAGRPMEGKGGTKGPVGRGHPVGGASWLLPLLLWPLL